MRAVIFDIDGTLANIEHRLHHVKNGKKDWDKFFSELSKDTPYYPIVNLLDELAPNSDIVFCSGRPEKYREDTIQWFKRYGLFVNHDRLYMRPDNDTRPDFVVKEELLQEIKKDGYKPWLVIDDRKSVVDMWRRNGLTCLQCRDWDDSDFKGGQLHILVGPSGAGKSTFLEELPQLENHNDCTVSSDQLREFLTGDFRDQSRNDDVFSLYHDHIEAALKIGMEVWADATHIRRKDRMAVAALNRGHPVAYHVINRPMADKYRDAGWRAELGFDLIAKHEQTFNSQLKDIMAGDYLPNVQVIDQRVS